MPRGQNSVKGVIGGLTKAELATYRETGQLPAAKLKQPQASAPPPPPPAAPPPTESAGATVIPIRAPVTLGDALRAVAPSAPGDASRLLPQAPTGVPAPPASAPPPAEPGTESFCEIAGSLTANVAVLVMAGQIRRSNVEPEMPDDDDIDEAATATAGAFRRGLGDAPIPWWAGLLAAYGNLYLGMRTGGRVLTDDEIAAARAKKQNAAPGSPPPPPAEPTAAGAVASVMATPRPPAITVNSTR